MKFISDQSPEKLRGAYYTDPDIASYLVRWVSRIRPRHVLEPSCGDGSFLQAVAEHCASIPDEILAFDIDVAAAAKARTRVKPLLRDAIEIRASDFLKWSLLNLASSPRFDAVVGNPPFVRYQYVEVAQQALAERILLYHRLPFTKHTNAWVPFLVASLANLRPGGRLAMVVPSELLHVLHAGAARQFLLSQCSRVLVIDPTALWFEDTLQGVVLLLAEKKDRPSCEPAAVAVSSFGERAALSGDPEEQFASAAYLPGSNLDGKWMAAFLSKSERDVFAEVARRPGVRSFVDVATVDVGIVTGANKFFLVGDATVEEYNLQKFAHPMYGRSEHVRGVIYDHATHEENRKLGHPTNFLWFRVNDGIPVDRKVKRYIELGEAQGLPQRYKCRIREPWYAVPSVYSSPVGMLKRCNDLHRLVLNRAEALTTDTAYRIFPVGVAADALVFSFLNSLTALSAELEGRHYGGGVLEVVPSEIEKLLIPMTSVTRTELQALDSAFRARETPEQILAGGQDKRVLGSVGVTRAQQEILRGAWARLRSRRHRTPAATEPSRLAQEIAI